MEIFVWCLTLTLTFSQAWGQDFRIGTGFADMTGLIAEGALYGFANPNQDGRGIHLRQYSRAFMFEPSAGGKRAVLVVTDNCMISQALHTSVMEELYSLYGGLYTAENVMLTAQHSHGTPGGFHTYYMYMVPSLGFINETADAYRDGIVQSISRAHDNMQTGEIYVNAGELLDASINRSPYSYDNNPEAEKDSYAYNTDKTMTILKFVGADDLGVVSFFPVHTTSMKNYNHLVSTDNKGYAAHMFEREMNPGKMPGEVEFIAAFAQAAEGDASPNTDQSRCNFTNVLCSYNTSTCVEDLSDPTLCTGRGPAGEQFEDTRIIGEKQYVKAKELFDGAQELLTPEVDYRFMWVNMSSEVSDADGDEECVPAQGYSMAAGATDGPGIAPFYQGMLEGIPLIDDIIEELFGRPEALVRCQAPKPVLIPTGSIESPWSWQPHVVPLQLLRIGDVVLIGVPGEITTMAGRRLGDTVKLALTSNGFPSSVRVIVVALSNLFTSYITTQEEYQMQRYEGGATSFGPHTLARYQNLFGDLAVALATGNDVAIGNAPPDFRGLPEPALDPILTDALEDGEDYGQILIDTLPSYQTGETAFVTFVSGNPRNDLKTDETFLEVQRQEVDTSWTTVYNDAFWETKFIWLSNCQERPPYCLFPNITGCTPYNISEFKCWEEQFSNGTVEWDIAANETPGTYRLVHYGNARTAGGDVLSYTGTSSSFEVVAATGYVFRRHSDAYYVATGADEADDYAPTNLLQFLSMYLGENALNGFV